MTHRITVDVLYLMPLIGMIGGSGLRDIVGMNIQTGTVVDTPYGHASGRYFVGRAGDVDVVFLARHGETHSIPPHKINYRANIWGFKELGAQRIISINASGGINSNLTPGDIVILDQIMDFTGGARVGTYYDRDEVVHVDFTEPYCPEINHALRTASRDIGIKAVEAGAYACVNGPRLESKAEIKHFGISGADVIGMTGMPEAALARELELCFSAISVVTNRAAGLSGRRLTTDEVVLTMNQANSNLSMLLMAALVRIPIQRGCPCGHALKGSRM